MLEQWSSEAVEQWSSGALTRLSTRISELAKNCCRKKALHIYGKNWGVAYLRKLLYSDFLALIHTYLMQNIE